MSSIENNRSSTNEANRYIFSTIDTLAKASGIAVALLYFSGLLIVNAHFSQYGISRLSLTDPKYIIAGVWYIIFVLICCQIVTVQLSRKEFKKFLKKSEVFASLLLIL
jgi:tryptophan-rich sensory protein